MDHQWRIGRYIYIYTPSSSQQRLVRRILVPTMKFEIPQQLIKIGKWKNFPPNFFFTSILCNFLVRMLQYIAQDVIDGPHCNIWNKWTSTWLQSRLCWISKNQFFSCSWGTAHCPNKEQNIQKNFSNGLPHGLFYMWMGLFYLTCPHEANITYFWFIIVGLKIFFLVFCNYQ